MGFKENKEKAYNEYLQKHANDPEFPNKLNKMYKLLNEQIMSFNELNLCEKVVEYDKLSIRERCYPCHLLPYLWALDSLESGRQLWWQNILIDPKRLNNLTRIPQIEFMDFPEKLAMDMLWECINFYGYDQYQMMDYLLHFLLNGFGDSEVKDLKYVPDDALEHIYKTFDIMPLIMYPHDYFGDILPDIKSKGSKQVTGFYPTPSTVVNFMTHIITDGIRTIYESVQDPTVGTGRMLLYASNKSINLYGQDIDLTVYRACKVNMHLYAPFAVKINDKTRDRIDYWNNKLKKSTEK